MFVLSSKIKIGAFSFSGVHQVRIKKSINGYIISGEVKLPTKARLRSRKNPNYIREVKTFEQFEEGDPVVIELAYDGRYNEEFRGFVHRVSPTSPVIIEIEGYSYQLKKNNVNKFWTKTTVKEIMEEAVKGTDIKLEVADNMPVEKFMARNVSGAQVLDNIIKKVSKGILTAFFISPDTLWIGLRYTKPLNDVKYRLGYNVIRDDQLVKRIADKVNIKVEFVHKDPKGKRKRGTATNGVGQVKKVNVQAVSDPEWLKRLAGAKLDKETYDGLEGKITCFLEPFAVPGDKAIITDKRYDRNSNNIIETVELFFGVNGARRIIELGVSV